MTDNKEFWQLPAGRHMLSCTTPSQAARLRAQVNGYNRISGGSHIVVLRASPKRLGITEIMIFPHERAKYAPWDSQSLREEVKERGEYFIPCNDAEVTQLVRSAATRAGDFCVEQLDGGVVVRPRPNIVVKKKGGMRRHLETSGSPWAISPIDVHNARTIISKMNKKAGRRRYAVLRSTDGSTNSPIYWAVDMDRKKSR